MQSVGRVFGPAKGDTVRSVGEKSGIQVISRAAAILRALGATPDGLSLGQIARQVELPRSTVQRIVAALAGEGFISSENGKGRIVLGPAIHHLAKTATRDMKDGLRPVMQRIAAETGETVDLAVLEGGRMLFIDQIVGGQRLRAVSSIGERFPLTTTANGKAALACLEEGHAMRLILAELDDSGEGSREPPDILGEIEAIRGGALATDENEHTEGVSALGFAVKDTGGTVHAISVPIPSSRYERLKPALSDTLRRHRADLEMRYP